MSYESLPDIRTLTLEAAKEYLCALALAPSSNFDVELDTLCRQLVKVAEDRQNAENRATGSRRMEVTFSEGHSEFAPKTAILFDAA